MTKKTEAGQVTNYIYNAEDRLERVEDGSGSLIAQYYYDPFGRRLWKEVGGVRTYFVYADEGLVAEVDAAGNVVKSYGYRPGSTWTTDPLFMKVGGQYYFYQNDHIGTPQKMTAVNGAVVWSAKYSSFGEATVDISSTVINHLRFPGQYFDHETGLHYNYFRFYGPALGRYLKVDPIGFVGGNNLFLYVKNSPINVIDPLGLICRYEWDEEKLGEQISDPWWESQTIGYWSALTKKIGSYFIPSTVGKGKNKLPLPTVIPNSIFKYRIRSIKYVLYQVIKDKYWVCYDDCTGEQTKKDYYATIETDKTMKSAIEAYEVDRYIGSPWATNPRDVDPLTIDNYNE